MKNGGILLRKIRVALTPRNWFLKAKLPDGSVIFGQNRPGFGGRGIYIFRELIEPEFRHLEKFLVRDGVALTPPLESGCLAGVVRSLLVEGKIAIETDVPLSALDDITEAFLTSSTREVQSIDRFDGRELQPPFLNAIDAWGLLQSHWKSSPDP